MHRGYALQCMPRVMLPAGLFALLLDISTDAAARACACGCLLPLQARAGKLPNYAGMDSACPRPPLAPGNVPAMAAAAAAIAAALRGDSASATVTPADHAGLSPADAAGQAAQQPQQQSPPPPQQQQQPDGPLAQAIAAVQQADTTSTDSMLGAVRLLATAGKGGRLLQVGSWFGRWGDCPLLGHHCTKHITTSCFSSHWGGRLRRPPVSQRLNAAGDMPSLLGLACLRACRKLWRGGAATR